MNERRKNVLLFFVHPTANPQKPTPHKKKQEDEMTALLLQAFF